MRLPGHNLVSLTVTDDLGKENTDTDTDSVPVAAVAGSLFASFTISPTDPDAGDTVFFDGSASTSPDGIRKYGWNFGDGSTGLGEQVSHSYFAEGIYNVTLTIVDRGGREIRKTLSVAVTP